MVAISADAGVEHSEPRPLTRLGHGREGDNEQWTLDTHREHLLCTSNIGAALPHTIIGGKQHESRKSNARSANSCRIRIPPPRDVNFHSTAYRLVSADRQPSTAHSQRFLVFRLSSGIEHATAKSARPFVTETGQWSVICIRYAGTHRRSLVNRVGRCSRRKAGLESEGLRLPSQGTSWLGNQLGQAVASRGQLPCFIFPCPMAQHVWHLGSLCSPSWPQ